MTIELLSPAKINLGLEVIAKRDDGYHEIATVFQTISLFDRIRIEQASTDSVRITNRMEQIERNLAEEALAELHASELTSSHLRVEIEKQIPMAAGLGGASADAAGVIAAIATGSKSDSNELDALALRIGSDVPFLLHGGAALATGRGEQLESLPSLRDCWFVLVCPEIELERKTARLYAALTIEDFSDGSRVRRVADVLRRNAHPAPTDLLNVFARPLAEFVPEIVEFTEAFTAAGAPFVALSGAGPAHYTIVSRLSDAIAISSQLARHAPIPLRSIIARPMSTGIQIRGGKTRT